MQSGNPLLDMYAGQYATMGYPATPATVTQPTVVPAVTQSLALDANQANAAVAGGYLGFYSPFAAQQLTAAGLTAAAAGLPGYAAAAPPTAASPAAQQAQAGEARTQ